VEGKRARLVEIVSKETMEVGMSRRRSHDAGGKSDRVAQ
jgi:hypothetical protein